MSTIFALLSLSSSGVHNRSRSSLAAPAPSADVRTVSRDASIASLIGCIAPRGTISTGLSLAMTKPKSRHSEVAVDPGVLSAKISCEYSTKSTRTESLGNAAWRSSG